MNDIEMPECPVQLITGESTRLCVVEQTLKLLQNTPVRYVAVESGPTPKAARSALPICSVRLFVLLQPVAQFPAPVLLHFALTYQTSAYESLVPVLVTVHVPFAPALPPAGLALLHAVST